MQSIHKKIVTDESMRPVAVQIDIADWAEIERRLNLSGDPKPTTDLAAHLGKLEWPVDGLAYQDEARNAWP